ncbi:nuclear transport factor 2 family protein [Salinilacihabitans rarus]|uniref:nuclear transport factor 2 family protein n=1 Tax=Salinilacihabitans rarus TaxID=2961596 RepID=UPI0020C83CA3|nr:nuclear transport factor 2 family protein [Salinilacihabitans rarus]
MDTDVEDAEEAVRAYYDALRRGEPLAPFFRDDEATVKVGVSESLFGGDDVAAGLREQDRTTEEWSVESDRLTVGRRGDCAWFADEVALAWTDRETGQRWRFDTRWSGTLLRDPDEEGWSFASMHVSAPRNI